MQTYKTKKHLQAALDHLAENDKILAAAYDEYGTPPLPAHWGRASLVEPFGRWVPFMLSMSLEKQILHPHL